MKSPTALVVLTITASAVAAVPRIDTENPVSVARDGEFVKIGYTLKDAPAVITVDIQTNGASGWVSIGEKNFTSLAGDVNRFVRELDVRKTITWAPNNDWPGHDVSAIRAVVKAWAEDNPPDYMVANLVFANDVSYYVSSNALPGGVQADVYKKEKLVLRRIPAKDIVWTFGSPSDEKGRVAGNEYELTVSNRWDYYLGVYELTQFQFELMRVKYTVYNTTNTRGNLFSADRDRDAMRPVGNLARTSSSATSGSDIRWDYYPRKADNFSFTEPGSTTHGIITWLRKTTGIDLDLPTEAEWEFACRAGCGKAWYTGGSPSSTDDVAYPELDRIARYKCNGGYIDNGDGTYAEPAADCGPEHGTAIVGSYEPNAFGLYDMLGNVGELTLDLGLQNRGAIADQLMGPSFAEVSSSASSSPRGGDWKSKATGCRAAIRPQDYSFQANMSNGARLRAPCLAK